ncbi:MAG: DNA-deoxyinosine glycosylase [Bacilli bacterium]|nr:DNA-deoxyinosine glycosylase [Bacilli bacterium]
MKYELHDHEFPPLYQADSEILILGSFPSIASRAQKFFYGHPQNRFWKLLPAVYGDPVPSMIEEKTEFCHKHKLALYDSIESCEIVGSSDASIKNVVPADLESIISKCKIRKIICNGKKSYDCFLKYQKNPRDIPVVCCPSTSAANAAFSLDALIQQWKTELI